MNPTIGDTIKISKSLIQQIEPHAVTPRQRQALATMKYLVGTDATVAKMGTLISPDDGTTLDYIQLIPPKNHVLYHNGDGVYLYFEQSSNYQDGIDKQSDHIDRNHNSHGPQWFKHTINYAALAAAATSNQINLLFLPPGGIVHGVKLKHSSSFIGGSISAYTLSVGIAGNTAKYLSASDVFTASSNTLQYLSTIVGTENHATETTLVLEAISTGDNLSAATGGSVSIWILLSLAN